MDVNSLDIYRKGENAFTQSECLVNKIAQEYYSLVKIESPSDYELKRIEKILEIAVNNIKLSDLIDCIDEQIAYDMDLLVDDLALQMTDDSDLDRETIFSDLWKHDGMEESKLSTRSQGQEGSVSNLFKLPLAQQGNNKTSNQSTNKQDIKLMISGVAVEGALRGFQRINYSKKNKRQNWLKNGNNFKGEKRSCRRTNVFSPLVKHEESIYLLSSRK
ncbi:hypothetical protein [Anabaena sp. CCY 9910]|uniref:hypothetical protein n=1 Tax=Anabaena sp. CCY 9910 TaxID=3103870 RepID=UPI0039E1060B